MKYIRKTFTLPEELAEQLGTERNQSNVVCLALDMYFNHRLTIKRVAASIERIEERLAESPQPNKHPAASPYHKAQAPCCVSQRPNLELQTVPCRHWLQVEGGFKNNIDGEEILYE